MAALNSAFLFIKPDAVTDKVKELVEKTLKEKGLKIIKKGTLKSEVIDKKKLIDNHYYAIASKATILKPKDLNVPADKFKGKFGMEWQAALDSGKVFNALDGCEFLGLTASEMAAEWGKAKKADKLIKFGGGFYCGDIEVNGKQALIFNGFFMEMRSGYVVPGKSIFYYVVTWDPKKLAWSEFREKVCGVTDPAQSDAGSLRGQVFKDWKDLGLEAEPNVGENAIHASASPFEGLSERMNWLNFKCEIDSFGAKMLEAGISMKTIKEWCKDPQVNTGEKMGSCYDALEDMDAADCLEKLKDLWTLNRPKSTGRVSNVDYDFSNKFTKILAGKENVSKVYENSHVFAFLDDSPKSTGHTVVITKAEGYPCFLDMPHSKAAELTRELPKLAQAIKEATGASDVEITSHAALDSSSVHPMFHLIPLYDGKRKAGPCQPNLLAKINLALHPPTPLKKAKFAKTGKLNPDSKGFNLHVKATGDAVEKELPKGGKVYEVQVGNDSGVVTVSLVEAQKDSIKAGKIYEIRNASVKMIKGHIYVVVDKWGKIEEGTEDVTANTEKNVSAMEYELVK
jgi:diadenosine tetraphosphate (Ap4A) HIT family hydrolase/nucleoside diphosphate kinase